MSRLKILLLSTYESGHQPLRVAWPLSFLKRAGFKPRAVDLSLSGFPHDLVRDADLIGLAVPMHTALRLGVAAAKEIRRVNPQVHVCFYGLYAWLNADYLLEHDGGQPLADSVIAGEFEQSLVELAAALASRGEIEGLPGVRTLRSGQRPLRERLRFPPPERTSLPDLSRYARLVENGTSRVAGYVESTRGCLHTCRHCPVVPVYQGRFFVVPHETVMADIDQQIEAGARHITFGDPDFLNGPRHALNLARTLHKRHPDVTFDFTTKVEHILERADLFPELRALGAAFVTSAFESTSDRVLLKLKKDHTVADLDEALAILESAALPVQSTWVPFTPWTRLSDYQAMLDWMAQRGLLAQIAPVQLSIRLLVPPGSRLLTGESEDKWAGVLDAPNFTYRWQHPDPRMDRLQKRVAELAERYADDAGLAVTAICEAAHSFNGQTAPSFRLEAPEFQGPRLTEDWFC